MPLHRSFALSPRRVIILILLLGLLLPTRLAAQDENRAGIVVWHEEDWVQTACVTFSEESISGVELLNRSRLQVERQVSGLGEMVCRIGQTGCPPTDCLCQCKGGAECTYWSYWHLIEGEWQYSQVGAGAYQIRDGMIDGWVWGAGRSGEAPQPLPTTLDDICYMPTPTPPAATALAMAQGTVTAAAPFVTPTPAGTTAAAASPLPTIAFAALAGGLLGFLLLSRGKRRG